MPIPPKKSRKPVAGSPEHPLPKVPKELIDQFLAEGQTMSAEAVQDASMAFKKALIERALGAELSHHLGAWAAEIRQARWID